MSRITDILAWIEADGYEYQANNKHFSEYDPEFTRMFCKPKWTGDKNPGWYLGGASINYCDIDDWIEKFETFIKGFHAFGACAFISHGDGDQVFALGYNMDREPGHYEKTRTELGDSADYYDKLDSGYPLLFRILHSLKGVIES